MDWQDSLPRGVSSQDFLRDLRQFHSECSATRARSLIVVVRNSFEIETAALKTGDAALLDAIYVAFLEKVDFRSGAGKEAVLLMPAELRKGRYAIVDYNEKLLGRKLAINDRA
jgi:hypothetical protein